MYSSLATSSAVGSLRSLLYPSCLPGLSLEGVATRAEHPLFKRTALEYLHLRKTLEEGAEGRGVSFFLFRIMQDAGRPAQYGLLTHCARA